VRNKVEGALRPHHELEICVMTYATTEELIEAWEKLTDRDHRILRSIGHALVGGTPFTEPLELLNVAFHRCL